MTDLSQEKPLFTAEQFENLQQAKELIPIAAHEKIAGSIKEEYIPRLDEHHAYVEMLIRKAAFWQSVREQMIRKGAVVTMLCVLAAMVYLMGFEGVALKMVGQ